MTGSAITFAVLLPASVAFASAQPTEDEAHRLDRIETRRLNEAAAHRLAGEGASSHPAVPADPAAAEKRALTPAEQALRAREEQALDAWRRTDACHARRHAGC